MSDRAKNNGQHIFLCPKCKKAYFQPDAVMEEYVDCECGYGFYVYVDSGLQMPTYESITEAMERPFGNTLERSLDDLEKPNKGKPGEGDVDIKLAKALEDYQLATFGECYITNGMIRSVCESLKCGNDVELRKQKHGVSVIEEKKKNITEFDVRYKEKTVAYGTRVIRAASKSRKNLLEVCSG